LEWMAEAAEAGVTVGEVGVTVSAAPVRRGRTYSSDGYLQLDLSDRCALFLFLRLACRSCACAYTQSPTWIARTSEQQAKEAQVLSHLQRYLKVTIEVMSLTLAHSSFFAAELDFPHIIRSRACKYNVFTSVCRCNHGVSAGWPHFPWAL
jgi:hypothetical protein